MSCSLRIAPGGWQMPVAPGQSLLEAAQAAGIRLPRSCRNGSCRACRCQLTAGAVRYRVAWPGLLAEEQAAGWVLPCVALADGDVAIDAPAAEATHTAPPRPASPPDSPPDPTQETPCSRP